MSHFIEKNSYFPAGLENFLDDLEFMLDRKPSVYWRICWFIVTPLILISIFCYTITTLSPLTYGGVSLPGYAHAIGWTILCIGVLQIPLWMLIAMMKNRKLPFLQVLTKRKKNQVTLKYVTSKFYTKYFMKT